MRQRQRWLVFGAAGAAAVAVAIVVPMATPDPTPPFRFLEGARLRYVQVNIEDGQRICTTSYDVDGPPVSTFKTAAPEFRSWTRTVSEPLHCLEFSREHEHVTIVGWCFGTAWAPYTHVLYERPARLTDELRSPVYRVKSWF